MAHPARLPLKTTASEESGEVSFHFSEGCESNSNQGAKDSAQLQETSLKAESSILLPSSQRSGDDRRDKESKQEEGVMTCTKAIASLCIASEEPLGKVAGSIEQIQQHASPQSCNIQQESSARASQKFSGSEFRHSGAETPRVPATHYVTGAAERSSGQQGQSKNPSSAAND